MLRGIFFFWLHELDCGGHGSGWKEIVQENWSLIPVETLFALLYPLQAMTYLEILAKRFAVEAKQYDSGMVVEWMSY